MAQNANEYKLFGLFYVNYIVSYFFCNQSFKIDTLIPPNGEKIRKNTILTDFGKICTLYTP